MKTFQNSIDRWVFALSEEKEHGLVFSLPWKQLLVLAVLFGAIGLALLHPIFDDAVNRHLRLFATGASILVAVVFFTTAIASHGELRIEGNSRVVRLRLQTPWQQLSWIKPFEDFQHIQFYQVVDGHGLHNHWRIELVLQDGATIRLGYGLIGAFRRSAADHLTKKVSDVMGIPAQQLEKR